MCRLTEDTKQMEGIMEAAFLSVSDTGNHTTNFYITDGSDVTKFLPTVVDSVSQVVLNAGFAAPVAEIRLDFV
jgi:hypothetical protein